jgi:tetratricopeptide (TPR) repeat protein
MNDAGENPKEDQPDQPGDTHFLREFEQVIKSFAEASEAGQTDQATQAALTALMMAAAEAERNPTPDLKMAQEAQECESAGDWAGAEAAYRQRLALKDASEHSGVRAKSQMDLSQFLRLVGRLDEAWDLAKSASEAARETQLSPLIAMTVENQGACALARGDTQEALRAASEVLGVLEPSRLSAHMRARALIHRAECLLACEDIQGAEADLKASKELLEQVNRGLPGPTAAMAKWWEVRAKVDLAGENLEKAEEALSEAITYRQRGIEMHGATNPYAAAALARVLELLREVAERQGDSVAALDAGLQAKHLREQAHLSNCRLDI